MTTTTTTSATTTTATATVIVPSSSPSPSHMDSSNYNKPSSSTFYFSCSTVSSAAADSKGQSIQQRRLTRQRRLRDHDAATDTYSLPASPLPSFKSFDSPSMPLPLPRPDSPLTRRPESTSPNSGHPFFATPRTRKSADHDAAKNVRSPSNLRRASFDPTIQSARYDLTVNIPSTTVLSGNIAYKDPQEHSHESYSETISELKLHYAAKSAPTSVLSSPVTSPRRSSNLDFYDPSLHLFQDFNETFKVSPAKTLHSPDLSSLRSRSPFHTPNNIREGSQPYNLCSKERPESNAHPLPLPPKSPSPSPAQSTIMHQTSEISPSMKKGQWQKGKLIGRGSFGSVYHATNLETGASCAMKEVDLIHDDPKSADSLKQLEQEIRILRQLHHPNIVQYYGSEIVGDHLYIYMEYVHPGSIHKFIHENCGAMTESVVRNFTRHILSGLAYLHNTKTIHRDIKGANLLVDASGIVKLADFGVSKILTEKSYELSLKGSPYWMAPELMMAAIKKESNPDIAMAIDIWSLGCTIIEMLTGRPPWSEFEGPQAMFKVLHRSPPIPETLSSEGQDFLKQCFRRNPADRPTAATLLTHAFVQNLHDQDVLIHPQQLYHPKGDPGPKENTRRRNSPKHNSKSSPRHSIGSRIINKIHNIIGDKKYDSDECNHSTSSADSPHSLTEVNARQPPLKPTLNFMSLAPFKVIKIIRHI
ncbi:mitogen-activated protein kinase kinase kinase 5 isoform X1 [Arachis duranensis]|uniref:mitogen-activated protein kinase kinase kinase n=1 Tax=Arachis duranensis TaxID=130453 RepID=A0A6P4BZT4_ARADU|nr:mitogen-activated protein kinase kinase kinase 5 isoform X1 [Arachis duranensis]